MKTPREILFERHRAAESRLDAVRRKAIAGLEKECAESPSFCLRDFLRSLRWHLAGMSAVWLFIAFLHLNASGERPMMASVPAVKIPAPEIILASLRDNRRQLFEMIESQPSDGEHRNYFLPKPRSDRRTETLVA